MSGVLIYGGGDDKSEELTHCAAKAAKLGSDLFTLPFPSLSLFRALSGSSDRPPCAAIKPV